MNERIQELAVNAGYGTRWTSTEQFEQFMDQFALLIVRECASVVAGAVDHREPASTYVGKIKEHFGVE